MWDQRWEFRSSLGHLFAFIILQKKRKAERFWRIMISQGDEWCRKPPRKSTKRRWNSKADCNPNNKRKMKQEVAGSCVSRNQCVCCAQDGIQSRTQWVDSNGARLEWRSEWWTKDNSPESQIGQVRGTSRRRVECRHKGTKQLSYWLKKAIGWVRVRACGKEIKECRCAAQQHVSRRWARVEGTDTRNSKEKRNRNAGRLRMGTTSWVLCQQESVCLLAPASCRICLSLHIFIQSVEATSVAWVRRVIVVRVRVVAEVLATEEAEAAVTGRALHGIAAGQLQRKVADERKLMNCTCERKGTERPIPKPPTTTERPTQHLHEPCVSVVSFN